MFSMPLGSLIVAGVLVYLLNGRGIDPHILLNVHAIALVAAGTFGIFFLSAPTRDIVGLFRNIFSLMKPNESIVAIQETLVAIGKGKSTGNKRPSQLHPLIGYALGLWSQGTEKEMFKLLLAQRAEEMNRTSEQTVMMIRNLAKYPPALGMTGTVVGLVSLFSHLTPEGKANIGPSLAVAMTATFYGLILANILIMPLADRLQVAHLSKVKLNEQVLQILALIHEGQTGGKPSEVAQGQVSGGLHGFQV
jgi:chemotaxis protein MotA